MSNESPSLAKRLSRKFHEAVALYLSVKNKNVRFLKKSNWKKDGNSNQI